MIKCECMAYSEGGCRLSPWRYIDEHNDGEEERTSLICFHGVLPPGEVSVLLLLLRRLQLLLMLQNDKIIRRCYSR